MNKDQSKSIKSLQVIKKRLSEIVSAIDLNYILAEAKQQNYKISLISGFVKNKNQIEWYLDQTEYLSYNYDLAVGMLFDYLMSNQNRLVRINISSKNSDFYPLNRNIIIHIPSDINSTYISKIFPIVP